MTGITAERHGPEEITGENFVFLQRWVHQETGIVLDDGKRYLVDARLTPLVRDEGLKSLNELCNLLRATQAPHLNRKVLEAMTTNETLFFRDLAPFDALRETIIPELVERNRKARVLRFWSAAASSGQEAYSLAMMLLEMGLGDWNIRIHGTDLSEQVLERARVGQYLQIEVNRGLPARFLVKYFERLGLEWRVQERLRRMVRFERRDLREPMGSLGTFDVVLCRNVLIYFDVETKKQILAQIRSRMETRGYLLLGAAETTFGLDHQFERNPVGGAVIYQVREKCQ